MPKISGYKYEVPPWSVQFAVCQLTQYCKLKVFAKLHELFGDSSEPNPFIQHCYNVLSCTDERGGGHNVHRVVGCGGPPAQRSFHCCEIVGCGPFLIRIFLNCFTTNAHAFPLNGNGARVGRLGWGFFHWMVLLLFLLLVRAGWLIDLDLFELMRHRDFGVDFIARHYYSWMEKCSFLESEIEIEIEEGTKNKSPNPILASTWKKNNKTESENYECQWRGTWCDDKGRVFSVSSILFGTPSLSRTPSHLIMPFNFAVFCNNFDHCIIMLECGWLRRIISYWVNKICFCHAMERGGLGKKFLRPRLDPSSEPLAGPFTPSIHSPDAPCFPQNFDGIGKVRRAWMDFKWRDPHILLVVQRLNGPWLCVFYVSADGQDAIERNGELLCVE